MTVSLLFVPVNSIKIGTWDATLLSCTSDYGSHCVWILESPKLSESEIEKMIVQSAKQNLLMLKQVQVLSYVDVFEGLQRVMKGGPNPEPEIATVSPGFSNQKSVFLTLFPWGRLWPKNRLLSKTQKFCKLRLILSNMFPRLHCNSLFDTGMTQQFKAYWRTEAYKASSHRRFFCNLVSGWVLLRMFSLVSVINEIHP